MGPPLSARTVEDYLAKVESAEKDVHELLTPRERQVFQLAAEGHTCPEIGALLHLSERTVERHRNQMMHKLRLETQTDLGLYALRRGILPRENTRGK
jgi:DNA-binding NarL/FixJ family response regulator